MKIAIGNDHAGSVLRQLAIDTVEELGHEPVLFGAADDEQHIYTTPIAEKVGNFVIQNRTRGILICGSGVGMSIAANKIAGIRCVCCSDVCTCQSARKHNNTNVLALGGRVIGPALAKELIRTWLTTDYEGGRREIPYQLISELEKKNFK